MQWRSHTYSIKSMMICRLLSHIRSSVIKKTFFMLANFIVDDDNFFYCKGGGFPSYFVHICSCYRNTCSHSHLKSPIIQVDIVVLLLGQNSLLYIFIFYDQGQRRQFFYIFFSYCCLMIALALVGGNKPYDI